METTFSNKYDIGTECYLKELLYGYDNEEVIEMDPFGNLPMDIDLEDIQ